MGTKAEEVDKLSHGAGCLGKAADDEPVFILRAQDIFAAGLVRQWANLAVGCKCDPAKVAEARELADKMKNWPNRKYPD